MAHNALAQAIINAGLAKKEDKRGMFKEGFSTKLSYRTYQVLKAQEVVQ